MPLESGTAVGVYEVTAKIGEGGMGEVYRAPIAGGSAVLVGEIEGGPIGASWGSDDTIVIGTGLSAGLWRMPAGGGDAEPLTEVDDPNVSHGWLHFLSGADDALFFTVMDLTTGAVTHGMRRGTSRHQRINRKVL